MLCGSAPLRDEQETVNHLFAALRLCVIMQTNFGIRIKKIKR